VSDIRTAEPSDRPSGVPNLYARSSFVTDRSNGTCTLAL